jgi:hypothetical protein
MPMPQLTPRKGMPSPRLNEAEFRQRAYKHSRITRRLRAILRQLYFPKVTVGFLRSCRGLQMSSNACSHLLGVNIC